MLTGNPFLPEVEKESKSPPEAKPVVKRYVLSLLFYAMLSVDGQPYSEYIDMHTYYYIADMNST